MTTFISVSTNAFEERFAKQRSVPRQFNVRRPLRGIQAKPDTYAVLRVLTATGADIPLFDSSSPQTDAQGRGRSSYFSNFIIQQLDENRAEKSQIVETFGEDYVYFFGEQPRFLSVRGILLNTSDFNWKSEFWENYELYLRGTRLVEQNARIYFYFDDIVVEGYMVSAGMSGSSDNPHMMPFQFNFYISNYAILSSVGAVAFPVVDVPGLEGRGLAAEKKEQQVAAATAAASIGSPGGLQGFLAATAAAVDTADFAIQEALENVRNFFYGRRILVPDGLGSQIAVEHVDTKIGTINEMMKKNPKERGVISDNYDEYVQTAPDFQSRYIDPGIDAEVKRLQDKIDLQNPEALDKRARADLAARGVNVEKPSEVMLLLGRGAFAAIQFTAPFALGRTGGKLGLVDQGVSSIL